MLIKLFFFLQDDTSHHPLVRKHVFNIYITFVCGAPVIIFNVTAVSEGAEQKGYCMDDLLHIWHL